MAALAEGRRIRIRGTVQGVGFRPWVYRTAVAAGVRGRVRNDSSGVTIDAFGDEPALRRFEAALHHDVPPAARISEFVSTAIAPESPSAFVIEASEPDPDRRVSIPPDLPVCDDCLREIFDPSNRRFRYPFTNCTNCGPRFTIATGVPYDRGATTMAPFRLCDRCRREYDNVGDRRFHAQPTACPSCGPRLELIWTSPAPAALVTPRAESGPGAASSGPAEDPIAVAARALAAGLIVAVKGLGGFHLACDATSEEAVRRLRARKHRDEKPLAVMVPSVADAARIAAPTEAHRRLLSAPERAIVLVPKRQGAPLAEAVAPGNQQVGVMLAYTPLHHLLLADVGRPLVMTSGNLSDEPIAFTNADALARLRTVADAVLVHDRDIHTRCDDSVATLVAGAPVVIRRSRGYVPHPIVLASPVPMPVLGTGALLKNTFCFAAGRQAFLGPHIGDLENVETYESYGAVLERVGRFLDIEPSAVACDLHPDYLSTRYAEAQQLPLVRVQHHHAHVASAMAEHQLSGAVIGVAYDGTGLGTDGTSWGGEILVATAARFDRVATFRPIALPGGDAAVREPWRAGLALLLDAYDGQLPRERLPIFRAVDTRERDAVAALVRDLSFVARARGIGRYFDAFGALFLARRRAAFEGQLALEWNQVAAAPERGAYPFDIDQRPDPIEVDLRPTVRAAVCDFGRQVPAPLIAARFHNTLARATAAMVGRAARMVGTLPVLLTGGCFQNAMLASAVVEALDGVDVRLHRAVPPGDGGIALGQVVVAAATIGP